MSTSAHSDVVMWRKRTPSLSDKAALRVRAQMLINASHSRRLTNHETTELQIINLVISGNAITFGQTVVLPLSTLIAAVCNLPQSQAEGLVYDCIDRLRRL